MENAAATLPTVFGYTDLERVGRGGSSVVYRARQTSLNRTVAIKILLGDYSNESDLRRFRTESSVLGQLGQHKNVVDVFDAGVTADSRPFIVMRFYQRGTMADRIRAEGPLPPADAVASVIKLAHALQAAHDLGVIHRDIKPENILIDDDGQPLLSDFGVAAIADPDGNYTTSLAFSHSHVAPEVLDLNQFGISSDIYSLASTLFAMLTGHQAFRATTEARRIVAITSAPVPPIDVAGVTPQVEAVVRRAMSKLPAERPATATQFAAELERAIRPQPAAPNRAPTRPGASSQAGREPATAAAASNAAGVASAVVGVAAEDVTVIRQHTPQPTPVTAQQPPPHYAASFGPATSSPPMQPLARAAQPTTAPEQRDYFPWVLGGVIATCALAILLTAIGAALTMASGPDPSSTPEPAASAAPIAPSTPATPASNGIADLPIPAMLAQSEAAALAKGSVLVSASGKDKHGNWSQQTIFGPGSGSGTETVGAGKAQWIYRGKQVWAHGNAAYWKWFYRTSGAGGAARLAKVIGDRWVTNLSMTNPDFPKNLKQELNLVYGGLRKGATKGAPDDDSTIEIEKGKTIVWIQTTGEPLPTYSAYGEFSQWGAVTPLPPPPKSQVISDPSR